MVSNTPSVNANESRIDTFRPVFCILGYVGSPESPAISLTDSPSHQLDFHVWAVLCMRVE